MRAAAWRQPDPVPAALVQSISMITADLPEIVALSLLSVSLLQYPPPLIPPRGEVNAADAFDIGSFDEEDTKGIKV